MGEHLTDFGGDGLIVGCVAVPFDDEASAIGGQSLDILETGIFGDTRAAGEDSARSGCAKNGDEMGLH